MIIGCGCRCAKSAANSFGVLITERAVRARLVVIASPAFKLVSRTGQIQKPVCIQTFIAESAVERFDMSVLHRAAGLDITQQHATFFTPGPDRSADKFRTVIDVNLIRQAPSLSKTLEHTNDAQSWQACVCFHGQASRVCSSRMVSTRNVRPCANVSVTKSIAQR